MDRDDDFRIIVKRILQEIALMLPSEEKVEAEFVCDDTLGHYQLGQVGWDKDGRVDDIYLHVDVHDQKVWIQHDGTNLKLAKWLVEEGIPKEQIILAFHPPELRMYTEFGVA